MRRARRDSEAGQVYSAAVGFLCLVIGALALPNLLPLRAQTDPPSVPKALETFDAAWNTLNRTYFDASFHGLDWNKVRDELRPKAAAATNVTQLRAVLQEMLDRLGASHMAILPRETALTIQKSTDEVRSAAASGAGIPRADGPGRAGAGPSSDGDAGDVGLDIRILEGRAVVNRVDADGPAAVAGIRPGDILESLNGNSVEKSIADLSRPGPIQGEFFPWHLITGELQGPAGSTLQVGVKDSSGRSRIAKLVRRRRPGEPTKLGFLPTLYPRFQSERRPLPGGGTVGVIRFNLWMPSVAPAFARSMDEFRNAAGVVIDLRGNLGGLGAMILGISGQFLSNRVSLGTLQMRGSELKFYANPRLVDTMGKPARPFAGPVAILVDPLSLSAAEIFAGGMQAIGRARLFGETTGGQALPAVWDRLPNGDVLYHAFGDFVTPTGERLEGRGVRPDERVPLTRADLLAGRDRPLEEALHWIASKARVPAHSR